MFQFPGYGSRSLKKNISEKIGSGVKTRVGRVSGNIKLFFGLIHGKFMKTHMVTTTLISGLPMHVLC